MKLYDLYGAPEEKPLDRFITDGGFCGIFRSMACIGDSLSSGEFTSLDADGKVGYHDFYEYSWGQYIGRAAGVKDVYNFSCGGCTARDVIKHGEARGWFDETKKAQCYFIALGVNDLFHYKHPIGGIKDICLEDPEKTNIETFIGAMGKIIQIYKKIQPRAKFFLLTIPNDGRDITVLREHADALYALADLFENTYIIDLGKYGPVYDDDFRRRFFMSGHMNPAGYLFTAQMISSYVDYIIRHNPEDFCQVGFIGTDIINVKYKL